MQGCDDVRAVVHGELRAVLQRLLDVAVVRLVVFAADGEDGDAVFVHEGRGDVVLGRERVAGAEAQVGAAVAQGDRQVRCFGGDVEAGGHPDALQRLLTLETFADEAEHGHFALGPLDPADTLRGERMICDVVGNGHGYLWARTGG